MSKFKIGEKIVFAYRSAKEAPYWESPKGGCASIEEACDNLEVGKTYVVSHVFDDGTVGVDGYKNCVNVCHFCSSMTLETLIHKANEGSKTIRELYEKHEGKFQYLSAYTKEWEDTGEDGCVPDDPDDDDAGHLYPDEALDYRIKPTKKWEPFKVGDGWEVCLEGDTLRIGCEEFRKEALKIGLESLCVKAESNYHQASTTYIAKRTGIHMRGHVLPWPDADRILEALEEWEAK
jgi:hypothetical protein